MNANGKECLLYVAKILECDTALCRFGFNFFRFVSIRVVRGHENVPKPV
jgi:hypothetical protein